MTIQTLNLESLRIGMIVTNGVNTGEVCRSDRSTFTIASYNESTGNYRYLRIDNSDIGNWWESR